MSNRSNRCIVRVSVYIQLTEGSERLAIVTAPVETAEPKTDSEEVMATPKITFFDINNEDLRRNLEEIDREKFRGYKEKVARNEREGRQGTYERQEGV